MRQFFLLALMLSSHFLFAQHYDNTFNGTGMITGFTTFNGINEIELPIDVIYEPGTEKIIMMNQFNGAGGTLHRFNTDGTPDVSFGTGGIVEIEPAVQNRFINFFSISDGYAIAGFVTPEFNVYSPFVMHTNYDGTTDTDFGIDGIVVENSIDSFIPYYATMGNSGKISLAGWDYEALFGDPGAGLMQFNADGTYNSEFGFETFGIVGHTEFRSAYELADGRTLAYGFTYNATQDTIIGFVACYKENGELDMSFGDAGIVFPKPEEPYYNYQFYRAVQGADGSIYLGGILFTNPNYSIYIVKMDVNGNIDESFGADGNAYATATGVTECRQIVVSPDNEIYILSSGHPLDDATRQTHILKLLPNGQPDLSFSNGEPGNFRITIEETTDDIDGYQMIMQPDGKLVVTGSVDGLSGNTDYFLCRVVTNSSPSPIENVSASEIQIFPNPASQILHIVSDDEIFRYSILTVAGNLVQESELFQNNPQIDIANFAAGLYFIQLHDEHSTVTTHTFVKN